MSPVSLHMDSTGVCLGGTPGLRVPVDGGAAGQGLASKDEREDTGLATLSLARGPGWKVLLSSITFNFSRILTRLLLGWQLGQRWWGPRWSLQCLLGAEYFTDQLLTIPNIPQRNKEQHFSEALLR